MHSRQFRLLGRGHVRGIEIVALSVGMLPFPTAAMDGLLLGEVAH